MQANLPKSDGGLREDHLRQSSSPTASLGITLKSSESKAEATGRPHIFQVPPKGSFPSPRTSDFLSASVGQGLGSETSDAAVARQVEREDLFAAKANVPKERSAQRKNLTTPATTPSIQPLFTQPGSGTGTTPPGGGHPRPIANRLQLGNKGGLPKGYGARNARKRSQESEANCHR